ncbi:carboxylesterase, type B [Mollisia scopiformis]|uniref:Carboxylic ester hydrolase n=1 Tax=Mollisia scopiformis TaxID=149040 RepID=A0A194WW75_MOLSC|nr:carboxylesterase, type B [Mollisia scopiformis]KUJ12216.1 carboxylesterase, type B [Mollisia scopiformis]
MKENKTNDNLPPSFYVNNGNLTVHTRTGTFVGNLNDTYPDVRQFKYIPYAKPPVDDKRWTSPEALDNSSRIYDSTVFGPSCPQYVSAIPTVWALNITGNLIVNYGESLLAGLVAQNSAEDCLTLAVWTPASATPNSKLPVIHFLTGGGDVTGGINIPTQMPANWVHRSQSHIVVKMNYRVNIFGYPNARGLNGNTNFALQDQRKAVEWVAENIAAFGGDPEKITLWGQSAGAGAIDQYLFAWYEDPIIRASISSSGVAIGRTSNLDYAGMNFTFVAKSLACDFEDAELELECMRRVPMPRIENFVGQYQVIDNKYVFENYTQKYQSGQVAQLPKIIGTTAREASALVPYQFTTTQQGLPNSCVLRDEVGLPTFRYEWAGNFSNIAPVPWLGAYHYSDLYMLFGTYKITPGVITDLEIHTSEQMQDHFLDFVADPTSLPQTGWPEYQTSASGGGQIAQFGADGQVVQYVSGDSVEGACHIPGDVYNTTP